MNGMLLLTVADTSLHDVGLWTSSTSGVEAQGHAPYLSCGKRMPSIFMLQVLQRSLLGKGSLLHVGFLGCTVPEVLTGLCAVFCFPGAYFWLLFLPAWVLFLILQVNLADPSLANFPPNLPALGTFWDGQALAFVVLWILFQALLYSLPVGKVSLNIWRSERWQN